MTKNHKIVKFITGLLNTTLNNINIFVYNSVEQ